MYFIKISLPLRFGTTLVCDRFIYDAIIDLMIDLRDFDIHKKFIGKLFIKMIPKNTKVILINLNPATIRERREDLINDQSLGDREEAYLVIAKYFNISIVNNYGNIDNVHQEIMKILELNE
jgi:thymidylate kinase